jgi:hypothetical protein
MVIEQASDTDFGITVIESCEVIEATGLFVIYVSEQKMRYRSTTGTTTIGGPTDVLASTVTSCVGSENMQLIR